MNRFFKTPLLFTVVVLALYSRGVGAETSSESSTQNSTTSNKSADKPSSVSDSTQSRRIKDNPPYREATDNDHPAAAPQGPALFKLLDTDKDGRISLAEYVAYGKAADPSAASGKTSPAGNPHSNSASGSTSSHADDGDQARRIKDNPPYHKADHAEKQPAALPAPDSSGPSMLPSVSTRADKFTAEVFGNLDIDHDKFLSQAELDALIGAHQISQP